MLILVVLLFAETTPLAWGLCKGEYENARALASRIEHEWPLRDHNDPVSLYLQDLLDEIAPAPQRMNPIRWRLRVVRDYSSNAYSVGAGHIFVTEGMIRACRVESELAAILAHEVGHELAGHFCSREPTQRGGFFIPLWPRKPPDAGTIQREKGSLAVEFDLEKELEADRIAVDLLRASRFGPRATLELAQRMTTGRTHAQGSTRIRALQELLRGIPPKDVLDSSDFIEVQEILKEERPRYGR